MKNKIKIIYISHILNLEALYIICLVLTKYYEYEPTFPFRHVEQAPAVFSGIQRVYIWSMLFFRCSVLLFFFPLYFIYFNSDFSVVLKLYKYTKLKMNGKNI